MAKASYVNIAKPVRKRSATTGTLVGVRLQDDELQAVDNGAPKREPPVTRPYAIRRLVEIGLTVRTKSKQPPAARATRAKELRSKATEKPADQSATQERRVQRRRRLTRGPQEFREDRLDLPETKRGK